MQNNGNWFTNLFRKKDNSVLTPPTPATISQNPTSELIVYHGIDPPKFPGVASLVPKSIGDVVQGFVYAVLNARATAVADCEPQLINPQGELVKEGMEGYDYLVNLKGSHNNESFKELMAETVMLMDTYGDVFWYDSYDKKQGWNGIVPIAGYRIIVITDDKTGKITNYLLDFAQLAAEFYSNPMLWEYINSPILTQSNLAQFPKSNAMQLISPDMIMAFRHPNIMNSLRGASLVKNMGYYIDELQYIEETKLNILKSGSLIPFIVQQLNSMTDSDSQKLDDDLAKAATRGSASAGTPFKLPPEIEYVNTGVTHSDYMYLPTSEACKYGICSVAQVPPPMVGLASSEGRSNLESARTTMYTQMAIPLKNRFENTINRTHLPRHKLKGFTFKLKLNVPRDTQVELKKNIALKETGAISLDELRQIYDFKALGYSTLIGINTMQTIDTIIDPPPPPTPIPPDTTPSDENNAKTDENPNNKGKKGGDNSAK
jgi:hypothetical protein